MKSNHAVKRFNLQYLLGAAMLATLFACGGSGGDGTLAAPTIRTQPTSQTVSEGNAVSLSVSANGTDLSYQWYKDGSILVGATSNVYSVGTASSNNIGSYYVVVSNVDAAAVSNVVTIHVTGTSGSDVTVK